MLTAARWLYSFVPRRRPDSTPWRALPHQGTSTSSVRPRCSKLPHFHARLGPLMVMRTPWWMFGFRCRRSRAVSAIPHVLRLRHPRHHARIRYRLLRRQLQRQHPCPDRQTVVLFVIQRRSLPYLGLSFVDGESEHRRSFQFLLGRPPDIFPAAFQKVLRYHEQRSRFLCRVLNLPGGAEGYDRTVVHGMVKG